MAREVLLLLWSQPPANLAPYHLVELFAGECQVSTAWRESGRNVCSLDLRIGGTSMNFCLSAGFLSGTLRLVLPFMLCLYSWFSLEVSGMGTDECRTGHMF